MPFLHGEILKSGATFLARSKCQNPDGAVFCSSLFSNLYLRISSEVAWFPTRNNGFLWIGFRFLAFSPKP